MSTNNQPLNMRDALGLIRAGAHYVHAALEAHGASGPAIDGNVLARGRDAFEEAVWAHVPVVAFPEEHDRQFRDGEVAIIDWAGWDIYVFTPDGEAHLLLRNIRKDDARGRELAIRLARTYLLECAGREAGLIP